jgi:hypothetical protein
MRIKFSQTEKEYQDKSSREYLSVIDFGTRVIPQKITLRDVFDHSSI